MGLSLTGISWLITFFRFIYPMMGAVTKDTKVAMATRMPILAEKVLMTIKFITAKRNTPIANPLFFIASLFGNSRLRMSTLTLLSASCAVMQVLNIVANAAIAIKI